MSKNWIRFIYFVIALSLTLSFLFCIKYSAAETVFIACTDAASGSFQSTNANYTTARSALSATSNAATIVVGQSGTYNIFRSRLAFNTSTLPDNAVIESVYVKMRVNSENTTGAQFSIYLCAAQDTITTTALTDSMYARFSGWATLGNSYSLTYYCDVLETTGFAAGDSIQFVYNATGIASINKAGGSQFYLISSRDRTGDVSGGDEYVDMYDDSPYMKIVYSLASGLEPRKYLTAPRLYSNGDNVPLYKK